MFSQDLEKCLKKSIFVTEIFHLKLRDIWGAYQITKHYKWSIINSSSKDKYISVFKWLEYSDFFNSVVHNMFSALKKLTGRGDAPDPAPLRPGHQTMSANLQRKFAKGVQYNSK